jgi:hypothetical protein
LTLTSAPIYTKYSTICRRPLSEAANYTIIHVILMRINIYSLKWKGVDPTLFVTLTSAPFENKISTISL